MDFQSGQIYFDGERTIEVLSVDGDMVTARLTTAAGEGHDATNTAAVLAGILEYGFRLYTGEEPDLD